MKKATESKIKKQTAERFSVVFSVCTAVGAVAGAGFLSGRELLEFYGGFRLFPLAVSFAAFAGGFFLFLRLGAKYGGFGNVMRGLFPGAAAHAAKIAALFGSFVVGAATLSALNAAYPYKPLLAVLFLLIALLFTRRGISGVSSFGTAFTPFLIVAVLSLIVRRGSFSPPEVTDFPCAARAAVSAAIYVGMNVFATCPVLCDLGATLAGKKRAAAVSFVSAGLLSLLAAAILSAVSSNKSSYAAPLPLDYVLNGGKFYSLISAVGMLTAFTACFYPVSVAAQKISLQKFVKASGVPVAEETFRARKNAAKIVSAAAFFAVSTLPFETLVKYFYPVAGVAGAAVIVAALCAALSKRRCNAPRAAA